ncbi:hypothetical protein KKF55_06420 [Patescibacteria group bacterium]|nr:hypothetical protein [Patescibacteria group bacterium]
MAHFHIKGLDKVKSNLLRIERNARLINEKKFKVRTDQNPNKIAKEVIERELFRGLER